MCSLAEVGRSIFLATAGTRPESPRLGPLRRAMRCGIVRRVVSQIDARMYVRCGVYTPVYAYVCVYIYIYICVHVCVCVHICICVHVLYDNASNYTHLYMHIDIYTCQLCIHKHTYQYVSLSLSIRIYIYIYIYIYMHTHL